MTVSFDVNIERRMPTTGRVYVVDRMTSDYAQAHPFDVDGFIEEVFEHWNGTESRETIRQYFNYGLGRRGEKFSTHCPAKHRDRVVKDPRTGIGQIEFGKFPEHVGGLRPALIEAWNKGAEYHTKGFRQGDVLPAKLPACKITRIGDGREWIALFPKDMWMLCEEIKEDNSATILNDVAVGAGAERRFRPPLEFEREKGRVKSEEEKEKVKVKSEEFAAAYEKEKGKVKSEEFAAAGEKEDGREKVRVNSEEFASAEEDISWNPCHPCLNNSAEEREKGKVNSEEFAAADGREKGRVNSEEFASADDIPCIPCHPCQENNAAEEPAAVKMEPRRRQREQRRQKVDVMKLYGGPAITIEHSEEEDRRERNKKILAAVATVAVFIILLNTVGLFGIAALGLLAGGIVK